MQDLRGLWAYFCKILPHVRKHVQFINAGPKIWGSAPPKILGAKNMQNLARFQTLSHLDCEYLRNGQKYPKSENLVHDSVSSLVRRKKFGELWSTNYRDLDVQLYRKKSTFSKDHISALRGLRLEIFTRAIECLSLDSQHCTRDGVPFTIFSKRVSKLAYNLAY